MTKRVVLAGIAGGIVMFFWGAFSHMALQLGDAGMRSLPNDEVVMSALKANLSEPGFYFFPERDERPGRSAAEIEASEKAFEAKIRRGPSGILIYTPSGEEPMSPGQLIRELESNIGACLVAALLVAHMAGAGYGRRLFAVTLMGLICWLSIEVSYWNWYHFPVAYTFGQLGDQVGGFFTAGLVIAAMVRPRAT